MSFKLIRIEDGKKPHDLNAKKIINENRTLFIDQICNTGHIDTDFLSSILEKEKRQVRNRIYYFLKFIVSDLDLLEEFTCKSDVYRSKLEDLFFLRINLFYPSKKVDEVFVNSRK